MHALVVYESMYGNTHLIADAIARGLSAEGMAAEAISLDDATPARVANADLLVVGGPTHAHGMSRDVTRKGAIADAQKPDSELHLDPDAEGDGLRDWFEELADSPSRPMAAAFDTRMEMPAAISGRAAKGIGKRLARHGFLELVSPESFFVDKHNALKPHEDGRAFEWGRTLAERAAKR